MSAEGRRFLTFSLIFRIFSTVRESGDDDGWFPLGPPEGPPTPQHFFNFLPEPHEHGALRLGPITQEPLVPRVSVPGSEVTGLRVQQKSAKKNHFVSTIYDHCLLCVVSSSRFFVTCSRTEFFAPPRGKPGRNRNASRLSSTIRDARGD